MKTIFVYILLILSSVVNSQLYPVNTGSIKYLPDEKNGTDITIQLSEMILACNDGDVIVIPAGKFIITDQLLINKEISIIGSGSDTITGTMLYKADGSELNNFTSFIKFSTGRSYSNYKIFISGIYFKSLPSSRYSGGNPVSLSDKCLEYYYITDFIVTDNIFQYFGGAGIVAYHKDSIEGFNGLIFNNDFIEFYRPELNDLGYGVLVGAHHEENKKWILNPEIGSKKFLFVEDNYFRETRHAIAAGTNAKYVFRYNVVVDNWTAPAIDMHGAGDFGNMYSSRASESYGNIINNNFDYWGNPIIESTPWNDYPIAIGIRGGEALIYNNTSYNYQNLATFYLEENNPLTYPSPYQIGYLSGLKYGLKDSSYLGDHGDGDVYIWNNQFEQKFQEWSKYIININDQSYLKFNRDIQTDVEKPGYTAYIYPHDYRNYYYTFIDTFLNEISNINSTFTNQNSIQLAWNNVLCEDGYYIYESTDGVNYTIKDSTTINDTTAIISNLDSDPYWFYIRAYNDLHQGNKSQTIIINQDIESATLTATPALNETDLDNQSVTITLNNETFTDLTLSTGNFTLNNVPGLSIESFGTITSTTAIVNLAFTPGDFDAEINNFSITINPSELTQTSDVALQTNAITISHDIPSSHNLFLVNYDHLGKYLIVSIIGQPISDPHFIRLYNSSKELIYEDIIRTNSYYIPIRFKPGIYSVDIGVEDMTLFTEVIVLN